MVAINNAGWYIWISVCAGQKKGAFIVFCLPYHWGSGSARERVISCGTPACAQSWALCSVQKRGEADWSAPASLPGWYWRFHGCLNLSWSSIGTLLMHGLQCWTRSCVSSYQILIMKYRENHRFATYCVRAKVVALSNINQTMYSQPISHAMLWYVL